LKIIYKHFWAEINWKSLSIVYMRLPAKGLSKNSWIPEPSLKQIMWYVNSV
jgi:hypothetical protein